MCNYVPNSYQKSNGVIYFMGLPNHYIHHKDEQ